MSDDPECERLVFRKDPETGSVICLFTRQTQSDNLWECRATWEASDVFESAHYPRVMRKTVAATEAEYEPLLSEIVRQGLTPHGYVIRKRAGKHDHEWRHLEIRKRQLATAIATELS